ncbi:MAG TPA: Rieske (2Fe-2S) protein [Prolixibacteraceae bacterium]|jgi:cytochrome b6-f complex iron-sulfur subunit
MKRHEFFTALGVSAGTIIFAPFLVSCSKDSGMTTTPPGGGGGVDFTLDLSLPANTVLNTNGGYLIKSGVIVAKTTAGYVALASACTHQGYAVEYLSASNQFHCTNPNPGHGSLYSVTGANVSGPAPSPLTMYNVALTGTMLRVYA